MSEQSILSPNPASSLPFSETGGIPDQAPQFEQPAKTTPKLLWLWITLGVLAVLMATGYFAYRYYFQAHIAATNLTPQEQLLLEAKMEALEEAGSTAPADQPGFLVETNQVTLIQPNGTAVAPPDPADPRTLRLTEREINGMLNHNSNLGERVKVLFKPGYIDIQYVQPVDEQVALIGGKSLRLSLDLALQKSPGGSMDLTIRDVNIAGVPMPTAWLELAGIPKGENLLAGLESEYEFFRQIVAGIEVLDISSGELRVRLAE
tara:strand:+ start:27352 stop:28137 length:786 start_codon:yes stop_codon:yes gene_type:complete